MKNVPLEDWKQPGGTRGDEQNKAKMGTDGPGLAECA
jgi:hypothetical protein